MVRTQKLTKTSEVFQKSRTCEFCHSAFLPGEEIVRCPRCGAVHHVTCWQNNGNKCAQHLCNGSGLITSSSVLSSATTLLQSAFELGMYKNYIFAGLVGAIVTILITVLLVLPKITSDSRSLSGVRATITPTAAFVPTATPTVRPTSTSVPTATPLPLVSGNPREWLPNKIYIPRGMVLEEALVTANEYVAEQSDNPTEWLNILQECGRVEGYTQLYLHEDGCDLSQGIQQIYIQTILLEKIYGTEQYYDRLRKQDAERSNTNELTPTDIAGDAAYLFWYEAKDSCSTQKDLVCIDLLFRRFNALGSVNACAVVDSFDNASIQEMVEQLAVVIDLRIMANAN